MKAPNYTMSKQLSAAVLALMRYDTLHYMFVYPLTLKDNSDLTVDLRQTQSSAAQILLR